MNKPDTSRRALGKGIGALLPTRTPVQPPAPGADVAAEGTPRDIPIGSIDPNPVQPRRVFHEAQLEELAQSIRANGIIQPLVVRKNAAAADRYQLVAGERRLRAAKIVGLDKVPVVIKEIADDRLLEITLIENIQREDLNPIETAVAFDRLAKELNLTADQVGQRTGKDRTTIVNTVRLLQLPHEVQKYVAEGILSAGHARCLLKLTGLGDKLREAATRAVQNGWSVRELEKQTTKIVDETEKAAAGTENPLDPNVKAAITEMERVLGTRVRIIERTPGKGFVHIEYHSQDELDRIYEVIVGEA